MDCGFCTRKTAAENKFRAAEGCVLLSENAGSKKCFQKRRSMRLLTIGNVSLANPVILAPMAGVSDLPFRLLCHEQGAGMVCSEMISAKAILYHNKNTEELMQIHPDEGPVSLQLFGSDPDIVSEMARRIEERPFAVMDLNMGCPVPKVVNNGEGSALMKNPLLAGKLSKKRQKRFKSP